MYFDEPFFFSDFVLAHYLYFVFRFKSTTVASSCSWSYKFKALLNMPKRAVGLYVAPTNYGF